MGTPAQTPSDELSELHPSQWTEGYWQACAAQQLTAPRCAQCNTVRMPAGPFCDRCGETPITWVPANGRATLHSFTVARQAFHPSLKQSIPYVIAIVTLDDHPDVRLVSNLVDVDLDDVRIGMALRVVWPANPAAPPIPRFTGSRSG